MAYTLSNVPMTHNTSKVRAYCRRGVPGVPSKTCSSLKMSSSLKSVGVLFDVDGTLADSTNLAYTATNEVLLRHGHKQISIEAYLKATIHTTPRRMAVHAHEDPEHPAGLVLAKDFDETYVQRVSEETTPFFPGVAEVVKYAHENDAALGVLSNACGDYARAVCAANGEAGALLAAANVVWGADDVDAPKPAPNGLRACVRALLGDEGDACSRCVYVGDAPTDGMAASAAGCRSVGVTWGAHGKEALADHFDVVVESGDALHEAIRHVLMQMQPIQT